MLLHRIRLHYIVVYHSFSYIHPPRLCDGRAVQEAHEVCPEALRGAVVGLRSGALRLFINVYVYVYVYTYVYITYTHNYKYMSIGV